jgi:tight adherence protein B
MSTTTIRELLLAAGVAGVFLSVFLLVRFITERRRAREKRRFKGNLEDSGVLVRNGGPRPTKVSDRMDHAFEDMVERADLGMNTEQALGLIALCGVIVGAALYLWREQVGLAVGGLLVGMLVPLGIFWYYQSRHRRKMQEQLPDAIYLIARSLRAGVSLEESFRLVGEEGMKPLAGEFKRCAASLGLGLPLATALQMMAERVRLLDFNAFVSTLTFHQSTGGNLPLMLDRLAASTRDHNQFRGQFFAATAQGRITSIALALAVPGFVVGYLLFQPDHVQAFMNDSRGWIVLAVCFILEAIGCVWIYKMLKVDY